MLILYSQGYRFDMETKKIVQTGGVFLKIKPVGADIYINDKFQKRTNILFSSALIQNLLPKKYKLQVKKQGYFSWEKTLEVKEKQVTEAKNIILIPKNPDFEILTLYLPTNQNNSGLIKNIQDFWFSPDGKKILLKTSSKEQLQLKYFTVDLTETPVDLIPLDSLEKDIEELFFEPDKLIEDELENLPEKAESLALSPDSKKIAYLNDNEIWVLFLKDISEQPKRKAKDKIFLTRFSEKIDRISWYSSHYLIFNCDNKIKIAEIDDRDKINIVDLAEYNEPKIFFNQNDKKLYILSQGNLYVSEKLLP